MRRRFTFGNYQKTKCKEEARLFGSVVCLTLLVMVIGWFALSPAAWSSLVLMLVLAPCANAFSRLWNAAFDLHKPGQIGRILFALHSVGLIVSIVSGLALYCTPIWLLWKQRWVACILLLVVIALYMKMAQAANSRLSLVLNQVSSPKLFPQIFD